MAKRFKLKFSSVMPSFQLCRSKKPSNLPETPVAVIHRLSPVNPKALDISRPNLPAPPPSTPEDYSFSRCHLSPKIASVGCGCRARSSTKYFSPDVSFEAADDSWKKEATRLHRVANAHNSKLQRKTYEASVSDENMDKVKAIASVVSSLDSGCFSSEGAENEETETLISTSIGFSDKSSFEFNQSVQESITENSRLETKKNKKNVNNIKKMKRPRSFGSWKCRGSSKPNVSKTKTGAPSSETIETPTRDSMLRQTMVPPCTVEEKVRESVAVVKKSEDPYEDFKRSMLEMILEKQMFEAEDLEHLLQCFLSLNSRQHHGIIVEAFAEIWEALFCDNSMNVL